MFKPITFIIFLQAFLFSLNLSVLTPLINTISSDYQIDLYSGYLIIGGFNNLLLYGSMALSSLIFSLYNGRVSISLFNASILIANFLIYLNLHFSIFFISNMIIGLIIGIIMPTTFRFLKENVSKSISVQSVVILNIMLGAGLISGQYTSAIFLENNLRWNLVFLLFTFIFSGNIYFAYILDKKSTNIKLKIDTMTKKNSPFKKETILYLSQYLPGSIPWGALTVFIYPFSQEVRNSSHTLIALYMVIFSIGMLFGSILAGMIADFFKNMKKSFMLSSIIIFLIFSIFVFDLFIENYSTFSEINLKILFFFLGFILSIPGTYIKGLLFLNATESDVQNIFSIENFLESFGKGFGPLVVGGLIFYNSDIVESFRMISLFWVLCIIPILIILFDGMKNEKRY